MEVRASRKRWCGRHGSCARPSITSSRASGAGCWRNTGWILRALIPLPTLPLIAGHLSARLFRHHGGVQESLAALAAKSQETRSGTRVVKAHVEEQGELRAFRALHDDYTGENRGMIKVMAAL